MKKSQVPAVLLRAALSKMSECFIDEKNRSVLVDKLFLNFHFHFQRSKFLDNILGYKASLKYWCRQSFSRPWNQSRYKSLFSPRGYA